jgi:hypothetical protein
MNVTLDTLLTQIPSDTCERVERAKDLLNKPIREALRQETGLRLERSGYDEALVSIHLVPGLPTSLRKLYIKDEYKLAALLAPLRPDLKGLKQASERVHHFIGTLPSDAQTLELQNKAHDCLPDVAALAEALLQQIGAFNLLRKLFDSGQTTEVNEVADDILGQYHFGAAMRGSNRGSIHLYWGVIGLIAGILGVRIEELTAVVLTHELAHAYTHLGYDIDGEQWASKSFKESDRALKEGLAQHYTAVICARLRQMPDAATAFNRLLTDQPEPYHTHESWIHEFSAEEVRLAMIETRRQEIGEVSHFQAAMSHARNRLRSQ